MLNLKERKDMVGGVKDGIITIFGHSFTCLSHAEQVHLLPQLAASQHEH